MSTFYYLRPDGTTDTIDVDDGQANEWEFPAADRVAASQKADGIAWRCEHGTEVRLTATGGTVGLDIAKIRAALRFKCCGDA